MTTMFGITVAAADEFVPPGPNSFDFSAVPLFHVGEYAVTKPLVQLLLGALVVFVFFYAATRRAALVPGRMQFAGESAYGMVRNSIGRDIIGSHDFQRFVPYLVTLFFFILVNNVFAVDPAHPVPHVLASLDGLRAGGAELGHLQRCRHQEARLRRLPQAPDRPVGRHAR